MTLNDTVKSYLDKRILWVFLMGCASGFPWVLIVSALAAWLKDAGVSRTDIGLVGIAYGIYAFNFLWAPLVDRVNIPAITRIGQRKSWIILTQGAMAALTLYLATIRSPADTNPSAIALTNPAKAAAPAGSPKTPLPRAMVGIAARISSSATLT